VWQNQQIFIKSLYDSKLIARQQTLFAIHPPGNIPAYPLVNLFLLTKQLKKMSGDKVRSQENVCAASILYKNHPVIRIAALFYFKTIL